MNATIKQLVDDKRFQWGPPPARELIERLQQEFAGAVPAFFLELWQLVGLGQADGISILSPAEILELFENELCRPQNSWVTQARWFPFYYENSDFISVATAGPLAPRVAYLSHEVGSRLIARDVESFSRHLLKIAGTEEDSFLDVETKEFDYPRTAERTDGDKHSAVELVRELGDVHVLPRSEEKFNNIVELCELLFQLCGRGQEQLLAGFLETDHFIRRDARQRLGQFKTLAAEKILADDRASFISFAAETAKFLNARGVNVGALERDCLRVQKIGLNLDAFFHRRNQPNAMQKLADWVDDLINSRDPNSRACNSKEAFLRD